MKSLNRKSRLYLVTALILLFGLSGSVLIYLTAGNDRSDVLGYESDSGYVYPVMPEDSKMYRHDLELYGGKVNVFADELRRWFDGLWHGKSLALTVACFSVFISLGFFAAARRLPTGLKSDIPKNVTEPPKKT